MRKSVLLLICLLFILVTQLVGCNLSITHISIKSISPLEATQTSQQATAIEVALEETTTQQGRINATNIAQNVTATARSNARATITAATATAIALPIVCQSDIHPYGDLVSEEMDAFWEWIDSGSSAQDFFSEAYLEEIRTGLGRDFLNGWVPQYLHRSELKSCSVVQFQLFKEDAGIAILNLEEKASSSSETVYIGFHREDDKWKMNWGDILVVTDIPEASQVVSPTFSEENEFPTRQQAAEQNTEFRLQRVALWLCSSKTSEQTYPPCAVNQINTQQVPSIFIFFRLWSTLKLSNPDETNCVILNNPGLLNINSQSTDDIGSLSISPSPVSVRSTEPVTIEITKQFTTVEALNLAIMPNLATYVVGDFAFGDNQCNGVIPGTSWHYEFNIYK